MREAVAVCVDPAVIDQVWPVARELIRTAMQRCGFLSEFPNVENAVARGGMLLWLAWDGKVILAAAVTQLTIDMGSKVGTIVACAGNDLSRFGELRARLEQHFRDEDCTVSRINGRKGWLKHYPDYRIKSVTMEKVLS